eukprot:CAMPEP_0119475356 /NCGR_PEP_ID=MMETSP1344-20130328/6275_1 /TAXON_ID=236787 /ORGANISM="Florenciella parvula, Strain CCMP2471" /LENGTH=359 /DNA_ID=CAMNT_0007508861 /DNA_START=154 /DNA_END=1233 /DNA_ORIENTATION=-
MASSVMQMGSPQQFFRSLWTSRHPPALLDVLDVLPVRLLFPVFTYLDAKSLGRATQASMTFADAAQADELWRRIYLKYTGGYAENGGLLTEWKAILKDFVTRQVVLHYDPSVEPERHDPGLVMSSKDPQRIKKYHQILRVTIVGDSVTGKSTLRKCLSDKDLMAGRSLVSPPGKHDVLLQTSGIDFTMVTCLYQRKVIKLQVFDTPGAERFRCITTAYYRGPDVLLLCFNLSKNETLEGCRRRHAEIKRHALPECDIVLCGTHLDQHPLRSQTCAHDGGQRNNGAPDNISEKAKAMAAELGIEHYVECSGWTGEGVREVVSAIVRDLAAAHDGPPPPPRAPPPRATAESCRPCFLWAPV